MELHNDTQKNFKVDRYTAELITLTAQAEGKSDSAYIREIVRERILRGMTADGGGKSYYHVVTGMIKKLKEGKQ
jgi:hypothetical protein